MFRGFYSVASGMIAQQRKTEILTNNMANADTPGFKAEQSVIRSFPEMLMSNINSTNIPTEHGFNLNQRSTIGPLSTGVYTQETLPSFVQGQLMETQLPTDIALVDGQLPIDEETGMSGAVFFTLENDDGTELYTKNGNFALDAAGFLVNPSGHYVLDSNSERIQLQNDEFQVSSDGTILADNNVIATLGISFADNPNVLMKEENGLFATEDGANLQNAGGATYSMQQGFLEGSNVDAASTMTEMLSAYRAFEANQKVLQAYDRSMEKTVTEVGRVN